MIVTLRPDCPWYTDELRVEKQHRRRVERKLMQTRLEIHRQAYRAQCVVFNNILVNTTKNYYTAHIANCKNDQKQLFRFTRNLTGNSEREIEIIHKQEVSEGGSGKCQVAWISLGLWRPTRVGARAISYTGMNHHCYADNFHIYLTVERDELIVAALDKEELCLSEVLHG